MPQIQAMEAAEVRSIVSGLGDELEPLLRDACGGRLGKIAWFRADWQRGGARTGRSTFRVEDGREVDVVVKVPVGPNEFTWNRRLQPGEVQQHEPKQKPLQSPDPGYPVYPTLHASGSSLGPYDLAWIVIERLSEGPLFSLRREDAMELMADAAARFYLQSSIYPVDKPPKTEDWTDLLEKARENAQCNQIHQVQRWNSLIKKVQAIADDLRAEWDARPCVDWCHGDLHPANAMSRSKKPGDPAMLIDLAGVHAGHWIEDALYLERLYWPLAEYVKKHPPLKLIAQARTRYGLPVNNGYCRLADIRRLYFAATAPAFLVSEGNPKYLDICLNLIEEKLAVLKSRPTTAAGVATTGSEDRNATGSASARASANTSANANADSANAAPVAPVVTTVTGTDKKTPADITPKTNGKLKKPNFDVA